MASSKSKKAKGSRGWFSTRQVSKYVIMGSIVAIVTAIVLTVIASIHAYPLHASCKITWTFGTNCTYVNTAVVNQMKKWVGSSCGQGQKCLYTTKSSSATEITGTHTTPVKKYVDDLTFSFNGVAQQSCTVQGNSKSETWYAVLDFGTNYCNLHNLITGAALDKLPGYKETTSNSICTQYSSADCTKY